MPITDPNQTVATTVAMGTAITNKNKNKARTNKVNYREQN